MVVKGFYFTSEYEAARLQAESFWRDWHDVEYQALWETFENGEVI